MVVWHAVLIEAARCLILLAEADITTISQLAYCDPIQLAMRTNLGFTFVLDLVSEALASIYVGDKLDVLRARGLRGSYEFAILKAEVENGDQNAQAVSSDAAAAKKMGVYKGRKKTIKPEKVQALKAEGLGITEIANQLKISRQSVYRALSERR